MSGLDGVGGRPPGSPTRPGDDRRQPRAGVELGPGHRLPVHVAQRERLHEPLPLREAGGLQGPRLLRRRRDRHGALLGPAGDRRRRQDRLSARPRVGLADDGALGRPGGADAGQAPPPHRRLADRRAGGRVGPGDGGRSAGGAGRPLRAAARARRAAADQPAGDDEDARQPVPLRAGAAPDPAAWAPSSTASPAIPRRATPSSARPPNRVSRRRSASATSPSATSGWRDSVSSRRSRSDRRRRRRLRRGRIGAAAMLRRAGYEDVTVFEKGDRSKNA